MNENMSDREIAAAVGMPYAADTPAVNEITRRMFDRAFFRIVVTNFTPAEVKAMRYEAEVDLRRNGAI